MVASDDPDPDPDRDAAICAEDSDSSDSENWDGNSDEREVVPQIPVTAPVTEFPVPVPVTTQIKITIPAPPIKNSAVPQIKVPVTVPQVVRQIENNSEIKENHQASDLSSDDYMIRRRDRELKMPASDSSEDIGSYELKRRETPIKNFNSDSDSSLEGARYVFKRREAHMETGDSLSDSEDSGWDDVEPYMTLRRQPEVELSAQDSEGMSYDSEDIEIPTTPLRRRFRRRGIALRWRRNSLLILSLSLRRRLQFLVAKKNRYLLSLSNLNLNLNILSIKTEINFFAVSISGGMSKICNF